MWRFDSEEIETIERVRLIRLGVRLDDVDKLNVFERSEMLEIGAVEEYRDSLLLAKLVKSELVDLWNQINRKRR